MTRDGHTTQGSTTQTGGGIYVAKPTPGLLRAWVPPGATTVDRVRVTGEGLTIGRDPAATWCISDRRLSQVHARVTLDGETLRVADAGSTNGTFVNGHAVDANPVPLAPNDVVRVGSCLLVAHPDLTLLEDPLGSEAAAVGLVGRFHAARLGAHVRRLATIGGHVLLHGESGAGKELVAKLYARELAARWGSRGSLVAHNCARFANEEEATSTLFGVQAGTFTGVKPRRGLLEQAQGGVLFLDEIHALPVRVQQSLLRFTEDQQFARMGEAETRELSVRLVLGTNLPLQTAEAQGFVAADLVNRTQALQVPPLHHRRADVPEIFSHVLREALTRQNVPLERVAGALHPDQLEAICLLSFRGRNVRELIQLADLLAASVALEEYPPRHALGRLLAERYPDNPVVRRAGPGADGPGAAGRSWSRYERHRQAIVAAYRSSGHNLSATERMLKRQGIKASRKWLREYLEKWGER